MVETPAGMNHSKRRHETTDASTRNIVLFAVGLFFTLVISLWAMDVLFNYFVTHQGLGPPVTPFENVRKLPPESVPRLQVRPGQDMAQYRANEKEIVNSYGWVDAKAGILRIPIDRAMDLLLQKGLPVRTGKPVEAVPPGATLQYTEPKGFTPTR